MDIVLNLLFENTYLSVNNISPAPSQTSWARRARRTSDNSALPCTPSEPVNVSRG